MRFMSETTTFNPDSKDTRRQDFQQRQVGQEHGSRQAFNRDRVHWKEFNDRPYEAEDTAIAHEIEEWLAGLGSEDQADATAYLNEVSDDIRKQNAEEAISDEQVAASVDAVDPESSTQYYWDDTYTGAEPGNEGFREEVQALLHDSKRRSERRDYYEGVDHESDSPDYMDGISIRRIR